MATKEEMAEVLHQMLKIDVDFMKLSKSDLEKLVKALSDPSILIRSGIKQLKNNAKREIIPILLEMAYQADPLMDGSKARKGGPLGFGILPRVMGKKSS